MNRVVLLSRQGEFSESLCKELRQHLDCEIVPSADFALTSEPLAAQPHQIIIVDLDDIGETVRDFFLSLYRKSPEANIFALRGVRELPDGSSFASIGPQEVFTRPSSSLQIPLSADRIARSIRSFDVAETLYARLCKQMGRNRIVAKSRPMRGILETLPRLAESDATVLIEGETGTGKELIARALHYLGPRAGGPFVTVDCGAIPESLIENELFGHTRGAYTGASGACGGLLHEANGGSIFLDEVEALPLQVQTRFLRLLQEREYRPLGQAEYHAVNARAIASTNVDLAEVVRRKGFRDDLFHRLNVVRVFIPPLRERRSDIPALVIHFLRSHTREHKSLPRVPDELLEQWIRYEWPGNVRELENRVQEWLLQSPAEAVSRANPVPSSPGANLMTLSMIRDDALQRSEATYFRQLLESTEGNISRAAKVAGVDRKTLALLLRKRGIDPVKFRSR